ncbi:Putative receptor for multiple vacuolar hydrolases [Komagataella phaffii CBS 7435]|uniref:Putative receptor for multiple vacuolar hydrolases n=1 Tax=Komagataella phaffii (strain ATCC 76273 / CBS 7435 / CECT 11047 / NRRL Y-11430 / Wegner 21-1) TaxID=981350 RepID=F2QWR3_KOMPC|nr:Hypothetical protein BQ9382_C3-4708 [Komagataella phaffii CBS 7435]CCA39841.1 Putative receptor for multiple vacuolar hydrolases [Komagataella phaffii CBS 7435]
MFPPELGFDGSWAGATCKVFEGEETEHPLFFHLRRSVPSKYLYLFYGALFKSNIEDGSYKLVSDYVNSDRRGVDFELISGLKGTALINIVINHEAIESGTVDEKSTEIKTKITYDDASSWSYITPPPFDLERNEFICKGEEKLLEDCSLNFKGPTERRSIEIKSSCDSGKGLLFGVGNVGKYSDRDPSNLALYFSNDGGVSWRVVAKVYDLVYSSSGASRKFIVLENEYSVPDRERNIRNLYTIGFSYGDDDSEFWNSKTVFGGVQYNDKHGTLFTLLSVSILGGAWFVYNRGIKRNGGFSRLNNFAGQNVESSSRPIEENNTDKVVNCIIRVFFSTYQLFQRSVSTVFKELLPNRRSSSQDDVDQPFLGNQMDSERLVTF